MRGVTAPAGWLASGVAAGTKPSRDLDLALVCSERPATVAGAFTTNRALCAHIHVDRPRVEKGRARAVLTSAGIANAATGAPGIADAEQMTRIAAEAVGVPVEEMLTCATGVIGGRIPVDRIEPGIRAVADALSPDGGEDAARAIMTTDTTPKLAERSIDIAGTTVTVGGIAKGAGMIAPRLEVPHATMLAYLTTDAAASPEVLAQAVDRALPTSFNAISVDGATSTNDTVLLFANGAAGVDAAGSESFAQAVVEIMRELAYMIVEDGEGASRVIRIRVTGAATDADATTAARAVADNILFRAAIWGGDPNTGRVLQALGQAPGITHDPDRVRVEIGGVEVATGGVELQRTAEAAKTLAAHEVSVDIDLGVGAGQGEILTCDLTPEYVKCNADYST